MIISAIRNSFLSYLGSGALLFALVTASGAQSLPEKIRGYKVHHEPLRIIGIGPSVTDPTNGLEIQLATPELTDISFTGLRLTIGGELRSIEQSGKIDFVTFHDFKVGGIPVEVEEYAAGMEIKRGKLTSLPRPVGIVIPPHRLLQAAWKEMSRSSKTWRVTGRAFVFGKFRKMGFSFKRVIPVIVDVTIPNPLVEKPAPAPAG